MLRNESDSCKMKISKSKVLSTKKGLTYKITSPNYSKKLKHLKANKTKTKELFACTCLVHI